MACLPRNQAHNRLWLPLLCTPNKTYLCVLLYPFRCRPDRKLCTFLVLRAETFSEPPSGDHQQHKYYAIFRCRHTQQTQKRCNGRAAAAAVRVMTDCRCLCLPSGHIRQRISAPLMRSKGHGPRVCECMGCCYVCRVPTLKDQTPNASADVACITKHYWCLGAS